MKKASEPSGEGEANSRGQEDGAKFFDAFDSITSSK